MRAIQLRNATGGVTLVEANIPQPAPGPGEVLVRVHAAGVIPTELGWYPTTHAKTGEARNNAVPGHEFSGVIAAVGKDVTGVAIGQEIYGMNDWFADGATADYCITLPASIAPKPKSLTHIEAASVPISALTAWQGFIDHAKLQAGERVLIHGGAGAVGMFAVQLAHAWGAHVIATASEQTLAFVSKLGADEVIDYRKERFEDRAGKVDVVFDTVGGETLQRSWSVLKPEGRMITIASDVENADDPKLKAAFFIVEPNHDQLNEVARMLDAGTLRTFVGVTVPFEQAADAYTSGRVPKAGPGKIVISVAESS
jgi:NADPH:quinone reductase-like Zn-dependent oxidoreductase